MEFYEINQNTLVLIPIGKKMTKVLEYDKVLLINQSSLNIIKSSCLYYGCSFQGQKEGAMFLLGTDIKVPIVIEKSKNIIFFPTSSCIREDSVWVSYQNLIKYQKFNDISTILYFFHHISVKIGCKYSLVDIQYIKCLKLENFMMKRINFVNT